MRLYNIDVRRRKLPLENSDHILNYNIIDDIHKIKSINFYFRPGINDGHGLDQWIIDIYFEDLEIPELCIKLPGDLTHERVEKYCMPLIELKGWYSAPCST